MDRQQNKQSCLIRLYIAAAAINVALNALMIPPWGASGAALASLITQIGTGFVLPFLMKDLRENAKLMLEAVCLKDVLPKKNERRQ